VIEVTKGQNSFIFKFRQTRRIQSDYFNLDMHALHSFETPIKIYQSARRNIPEDLNLKFKMSYISTRIIY
jgi:hypothetical protein